MWKRLSVQNFKALRDVVVDFEPLTLIVGNNSTGKTSVLEAMRYLALLTVPFPDERELDTHRVGRLFAGRRDPTILRSRGSFGPITLEALLDHVGSKGAILRCTLIGPHPADSSPASQFQVTFGDPANPVAIELPEAGSDVKRFSYFQELDRSAFGRAVLLRADPQSLAAPHYSEDEVPELRANGLGLASVLEHLFISGTNAKEQIETELQKIVPAVQGIQLKRARIPWRGATGVPEERTGHEVQLKMRGAGWLSANQVSEGTLLVLGILTLLHSPNCPRLILIDDVERGLHPGAQAKLAESLRRLLAERSSLQLVCTSHSPYLIDHARPDEVRVMALDDSGAAHCKPLMDHPDWERWKDAMSAGEFWSSVGEQWVAAQ